MKERVEDRGSMKRKDERREGRGPQQGAGVKERVEDRGSRKRKGERREGRGTDGERTEGRREGKVEGKEEMIKG